MAGGGKGLVGEGGAVIGRMLFRPGPFEPLPVRGPQGCPCVQLAGGWMGVPLLFAVRDELDRSFGSTRRCS